MPNDLPAAIRTALRSTDITESDLRQTTLPERPPRRIGALLAAAAVVVAVAVLAGVLALPRHGDAPTRTGSGSSGFAGHTWTVVEVHYPAGNIVVPDRLRVSFRFTRGGAVNANDGVNGISGRYTETPSGYVVRKVVSSGVGYAGSDTDLIEVREAVDAMFIGGSPLVEVSATVSGQTLTLNHASYGVTLRMSGS